MFSRFFLALSILFLKSEKALRFSFSNSFLILPSLDSKQNIRSTATFAPGELLLITEHGGLTSFLFQLIEVIKYHPGYYPGSIFSLAN